MAPPRPRRSWPGCRRSSSGGWRSPFAGVAEDVVPQAGIPTGVVFGDALHRLIAAGVIDPDKFRRRARDLRDWVDRLVRAPSDAPLRFDKAAASHLVNLLWPVGLANKVAFNKDSPIARPDIPNFAGISCRVNAGRAVLLFLPPSH
jgi:hypothetical protein